MPAPNAFAPPTQDELDLFAPPSEDELADPMPAGGGPQGSRHFVTRAEQRAQIARDFAASQMHRGGAQEASDQQLAMLGTGTVAEGAGLLTEIGARARRFLGDPTNPDPKAQREQVTNALTYKPTMPGAAEQVGKFMAPVSKLLGPIADAAGAEKRRFEGTPVLQDLWAAPFVAGEALLYTGGAPGAEARAGARLAKDTRVAADKIRAAGSVAPQARAAGFDVTPSTVAGTRSVEPSGYRAAMEGPTRAPEASLRNAQQANRRLGDELNVQPSADGRLEPQAFDEARRPAFGVYEEAKAVPGGPSPEYSDAVAQAIQGIDIPTEAAPEVARLMQRYGAVGDSAQLVEDLKNLRRTAAKRREGDTANQVVNEALSDVGMAIADELENELGRRAAAAGDAGFQQRLQQARVHLAQLYEAERATVGGYVDAGQLSARQQKTGKLTGELGLLANMGENMPDVFQHPLDAAQAVSRGQRTPEAWGTRSLLFRMGEKLGGGMLSRRAMRDFNNDIPFGPNALDPFRINPVRDRGYPSPMGPNAGPVMPPQPEPPFTPWAGPLALAPDMPEGAFSNVLEPRQGRQLAENLPFSLEGQPAGAGPLEAFGGDMLPWEAPGEVPPLQGPRMSFADQLGPVQPRLDEALGTPPAMPNRPRGVTGPRSAQLSEPTPADGFSMLLDDTPPPQGPNFGPADEFPGPAPTGGASGQIVGEQTLFDMQMLRDVGLDPRMALKDPAGAAETVAELLRGPVEISPFNSPPMLEALAKMRLRQGPADEFPGPAPAPAPVGPAPQGPPGSTGVAMPSFMREAPAEAQNISDLIGGRLYRGVPEGADPMAPNERGFTTWSNERPVAERYGSNIGEMQFDPATNIHLGSLEDARMMLQLPASATAQDIAEAAMKRFGGGNKTASYDLPPEMSGVPREYIRFGP